MRTHRPKTNNPRLQFENLEHRRVLAATVYIDPGFGFFDQGGFQISDADSATLNGPQLFGSGQTLSTLSADLLDQNPGADVQAYFDFLIADVQEIFAPFDVDVVYAEATSVADIQATLQSSATNDAYIYVGGSLANTGSNDFGAALIDAGNAQDNIGFVFGAGDPLNNRYFISAAIARQAGKSFGLSTTEYSDAATSTDVMAVPGTNAAGDPTSSFQFGSFNKRFVFQRYDMPQSTVNGATPGQQNSLEALQSAVGGNTNGAEYFTTTGSSNHVSIEFVDANLINFTLNDQVWSNVDVSNSMHISGTFSNILHFTISGTDLNLTASSAMFELQEMIFFNIRGTDSGNASYELGDGDDHITLGGPDFLDLDAGDGNDTIVVEAFSAYGHENGLVIRGGNGDDRFVLPSILNYGFPMDPGEGFDVLDGTVYVWDVDENGFTYGGINGRDFQPVRFYSDFEGVASSATLRFGFSTCFPADKNGCRPASVPARADFLTAVVDDDVVTITDRDSGQQLVLNQGTSALGHEVFVRSTAREISIDAMYVQLASDANLENSTTDGFVHDITILNGDLEVSFMAGEGRNVQASYTGGLHRVVGLTGAAVTLGNSASFTIHGSNTGDDVFSFSNRIRGTVFGYGGNDHFQLDLIYGVELVGGEGSDVLIVDDSTGNGPTHPSGYDINDRFVRKAAIFGVSGAKIQFDSIEKVRVLGHDGSNNFRVDPSTDVIFEIFGGLAKTGDGDSMVLVNAPATRYHVVGEGDNRGAWFFGNHPGADRLVTFDSVETIAESNRMALASQPGTEPLVSVYNSFTREHLFDIRPYESGFRGGLQVATGNFNNDGIPDIVVAPGVSRYSRVLIYDGRNGSQIATFFAFPADNPVFRNNYTGGVNLAVGNVLGGEGLEILVSTMNGTPDVRTFAQTSETNFALTHSFNPFPGGDQSGVNIETGYFNRDQGGHFNGHRDIVASPMRNGRSEVAIYRLEDNNTGPGLIEIERFNPYAEGYRGGLSIATGDMTGDGFTELIISGVHTGSSNDPFSGEYRVFHGHLRQAFYNQTEIPMYTVQAFTQEFTRGVSVTTRDIDLDGVIDHVFATRSDNSNGGRIVLFGRMGEYYDHFFNSDDAFDRGLEIG